MTISATTVSISFGIETNNAEAGPSTLPIDIQPFPPMQIFTEAEVGRAPFEAVHSNVSIVSSHPSGGTVTALPQEHKQVFENLGITTGYSDTKLIINADKKYIYTQSTVAPNLPKITEKISIGVSGGPLGTVQVLPQRWEATEVNIISQGQSPALDFLGTGGQVTYTLANHGNQVGGSTAGGNISFITAGTHSWTAPAGVTSVAVVCVGTGANGGYQWSSGGGGGGGLGYKNSITVVPGTSYTVVVGAKGSQVSNATSSSGMGGNSYFISEATVCGFGGGRGGTDSTGSNNGGYGGGYTGDGGGRGGNGAWEGSWTRGGGGAGGYSGKGGDGGRDFEGSGLSSGSGGGGGGGNYWSSTYGVGAGGGVGLGGEGTSGAGGNTINSGFGGRGGSGGQDGLDGENPVNSGNLTTGNYQIYGGEYGGGGGGSGTSRGGGYGGIGAVRIVWGASVAFPSTNVGIAPTVGTTTTQVTDPQPVFSYSSFPANLGIDRILANKSITTSATTAVIPSNLPTNQLENISFNTIQPQKSATSYSAGGVTIQTNGTTKSPIINNMNNLSVTINPLGFLDVLPTTVPTINTTLKSSPSLPKSIDISKDVTFGAPSFCNSVSQSIITQNAEPLGFFTEDGISFFAELTDQNDPRLTGTAAAGGGGGGGGGGDADDSSTGPVQSWS